MLLHFAMLPIKHTNENNCQQVKAVQVVPVSVHWYNYIWTQQYFGNILEET